MQNGIKNFIMIKEINNVKINTPCYIVDAEKFKSNIRKFDQSFAKYLSEKRVLLGYSVKTNHNKKIMELALNLGMSAEVVSDDEYRLALLCGYSADNIIFNGPQKSEDMMIWALKNGSIVNLDNFSEITMIKNHIGELEKKALKLGLRVNFNLENLCPGETTAGEEVSRFGFCVENGDFEKAVNELNGLGIPVKGVHMHYSSKTRSLNIYKALSQMAGTLVRKYLDHQENIFIDIGGGFFLGMEEKTFGKPTVEEYADTIVEAIKEYIDLNKVNLIIEPGAAILAAPISYLTKVINTRFVRETKVVTLDGSVLHINPFMASRAPIAECVYTGEERAVIEEQIVCGATCMENDRFLKLLNQREMRQGDYLHCACAGAYTMGFNSCFINLPPYIYIKKDGEYHLIREKQLDLMLEI